MTRDDLFSFIKAKRLSSKLEEAIRYLVPLASREAAKVYKSGSIQWAFGYRSHIRAKHRAYVGNFVSHIQEQIRRKSLSQNFNWKLARVVKNPTWDFLEVCCDIKVTAVDETFWISLVFCYPWEFFNESQGKDARCVGKRPR